MIDSSKPMPVSMITPGAMIMVSANKSTGHIGYTGYIWEVIAVNPRAVIAKTTTMASPEHAGTRILFHVDKYDFYNADDIAKQCAMLERPSRKTPDRADRETTIHDVLSLFRR